MEQQEQRFALVEFVPAHGGEGGWEILNVTYVESSQEIQDEIEWWADRDPRVRVEVVDLNGVPSELFEIAKVISRVAYETEAFGEDCL